MGKIIIREREDIGKITVRGVCTVRQYGGRRGGERSDGIDILCSSENYSCRELSIASIEMKLPGCSSGCSYVWRLQR